jgi:hypothetical protein
MTPPKTQFNWTDPDAYEIFMGRWSELLAKPFLALAMSSLADVCST